MTEQSEELDAKVLAIISNHVGKKNRISRPRLWHVVGEGFDVFETESLDRKIRQSLQRLSVIYPICSTSRGCGYWWAGNKEELKETLDEHKHRAKSSFFRYRNALRMYEQWDFETLPGIEKK